MPPKAAKAKAKNATSSAGPRVIYWFRTDLRLHDSPALTAALALSPSLLIPLWTWDPHYAYHSRVGPNRWRFLLDCQTDLSTSLTKLNPKQKLFVVRASPENILPKLFQKWRITHLVFEKDTDAYARRRDERVCQLARDAGVEVIIKMGRTLFDPDELVARNGGKATMSISQVQKAAAQIGDGTPARPLPTPTALPDPGTDIEMDLSDLDHERPDVAPDLNAASRTTQTHSDAHTQYTHLMGPAGTYSIPTLAELAIPPEAATTPHRGGESVALAMLAEYLANREEYLATFAKPQTAPTAVEPASTLLLSAHHHFGSLSIRTLWWAVADVVARRQREKKSVSTIPENLPGQLLFRDMYFAAQARLGGVFAQVRGNPVARFVDWHLQSEYRGATAGGDGGQEEEGLADGGRYVVDDAQAEMWFQRWRTGTTGFPWIDALMRQLRREGWIHHLGRHAVACFLTRGGCYVHWERGADVFEELLLDHEPACNAGNWMWLSCTAFYAMFYRCYSPVAFPKKWDDNGDFVRRYCPELSLFDKKYIYEPHKAPVADQKKWGCLIRGDGSVQEADGLHVYPKPMFDFNERRQICIDKIKHAYSVGLHGADEQVMNGEWKKVFKYGDQSGDGEKDEMNTLVERGKKRKEPEGDDDVEQTASNTNRAEKSGKKSAAATPKKGKKQTSLDAHVGKKKTETGRG